MKYLINTFLILFLLTIGFIGNEYNLGWVEMMTACFAAAFFYDKIKGYVNE